MFHTEFQHSGRGHAHYRNNSEQLHLVMMFLHVDGWSSTRTHARTTSDNTKKPQNKPPRLHGCVHFFYTYFLPLLTAGGACKTWGRGASTTTVTEVVAGEPNTLYLNYIRRAEIPLRPFMKARLPTTRNSEAYPTKPAGILRDTSSPLIDSQYVALPSPHARRHWAATMGEKSDSSNDIPKNRGDE